MPNIVNAYDFEDRPLKIPNAVNESAGMDKNDGLTAIISENERTLLLETLGLDQYQVLQAELVKMPFVENAEEAAAPEYVELVNGDGGEWQGLKPMLKNRIYCAWLRDEEISLNMAGTGRGMTEGYTIADMSSKFVQRWNMFVFELSKLEEYLEASDDLDLPSDFPFYETENTFGL